MRASPVRPLPAVDVAYRVDLAEHCLTRLVSGCAEWGDWDVLRIVVNFLEAFVQLGYALDPDGLLWDADIALRFARCDAELRAAKPSLAPGPGRAVLDAVEAYRDALAATPARSVIRAMRATERAMTGLPP